MKFILASLLFCASFCNGHGQSATIQDPDGWTNVRAEPDVNSRIIHRVYEGEFFFWDSPDIEEEITGDWATVYIPKNRYSLGESMESPTMRGYIHRSRILPVEEVPEYEGSDFYFEYQTAEFDTVGKTIEYLNGEVYRINGRQIHGNDLSTPGRQVNRILVEIAGEAIPIHPVFFECDNEFTVRKIGELFIVNQWNSDGAGAYELVWVLDKEGVRQRLVGTII